MQLLQEEFIKSSDIGLLRLSFDLNLIEKNRYADMYMKIPRKGAGFANALFSDESFEALKALSREKGSYLPVRFKNTDTVRQGLAVRIKDDGLAVVFHTSFSMADHLGAKYSSDVLRVIAQCVVNIYEPNIFALTDVRQPIVFSVNNSYDTENRKGANIVFLSDSAAMMKKIIKKIRPVGLLRLELMPTLMTRASYVDMSVIAYALSELFACSLLYSARTSVKISVGYSNGAVEMKATGDYLISSEKLGKIAPTDRANIRFVLVAGVLSAIGISASADVSDGRFSITLSYPVNEMNSGRFCFENTVMSGILATRIFDCIIDFIGLYEKIETKELTIDLAELSAKYNL